MNTQKQNKQDIIDKCFLIFRQGDLPLLMRPVRVRVESECVLTGKVIEAGDYAYPCYSNPIRLSPYGPDRVNIGAAIKRGAAILPAGFLAAPVPTCEDMMERGKFIDKKRNKYLAQETVKLLGGKAVHRD